MGEGTSSALGPPSSSPHGRGGLPRFATTESLAAWARGPRPFWDHRGPRLMGEGASSILGPRTLAPQGRGGLPHFGTTKVAVAWARRRLPRGDH